MSDAIEQPTTTPDAKPLKDWRKIIAGSSLPDDVKRLIETVVRKTRLWKRERASVARELIAHFHDAADAGVSSEEAIKRFGDAKQAAKLIRRAKIRNRSWLWHARRFAQRVMLVLILCYIGVGVYYYMGKPSPSVDYIAKLNAPILATPESEWAWPFYRRAAIMMKAESMPNGVWDDSDGWSEVVQWLDRNEAAIKLIRKGAEKSALGVPLSYSFSPDDVELFGSTVPNDPNWPVRSMITIMLPHLNHVRSHSVLISADAKRATEVGDAVRLLADIQTLYSMSEQLRQRDFLVTELVSWSIRSQAHEALGRVLRDKPALLSDDALRTLAHSQTRLQSAADLVTFKGERYMFYDLVQRIYTDNGQGDGRITPTALEALGGVNGIPVPRVDSTDGSSAWMDQSVRIALAPAMLLVSASRHDLTEKYDKMMDATEARLSHNLFELEPDTSYRQVKSIQQSHVDSIRYAVLTIMMPAFNHVQATAERVLGQQEGLQAAIALELYRRKQGAYPASLDAMVPQYLPKVPADRVTGEPLCYRLRDGKPVVYSRGMDRDDDGGIAPVKNGEPAPSLVAIGGEPVDGDWVLFPIP